MTLAWHPLLIPGILAFVLSWIAAGFLLRFSASLQARLVAYILVVEGAAVGAVFALLPAVRDPGVAAALRGVEFASQLSLIFLYLVFLGTVRSPVSRWLGGKPARWTFGACAVTAFLVWPLISAHVLHDAVVVASSGPWRDVGALLRSRNWGASVIDAAYSLVLLFGFVVALAAWHRHRSQQQLAYLWAFGVRDISLSIALARSASGSMVAWPTWTSYVTWFSITVGYTAFLLILTYGILRVHLFGIDVRIKWTLRQSTVAAIFIGLFFVVSESAAQFFSESVGTYMGILAAGMLLFALAPLQDLAQALADRAMPGVRPVEELSKGERDAIYRREAEAAWQDGALSRDERALLDRLRQTLGLPLEEAVAIETSVAR